MSANLYQSHLATRQAQEATAAKLIAALSLLTAKDVTVSFFGERVALSVAKVLALHDQHGVDVAASLALTESLVAQGTATARIDLGQAIKAGKSAADFAQGTAAATDVVLYGFGRIGRILARLLMSRPASSAGLQLKAIVVRPAGEGDLAKRASLQIGRAHV